MHNRYEFKNENNNLKITLADRYFSMYDVVSQSRNIFIANSVVDSKNMIKMSEELYKVLQKLKNNMNYPISLNIILSSNQFSVSIIDEEKEN